MKFASIVLSLVLVTSIFSASSYAHVDEIVSGYKIEVGWVNEPPVVGQPNLIEIFVTEATEFEIEFAKSKEPHDHSEHEDESEHNSHEQEEEEHDHSSHDHGSEEEHTEEIESEEIIEEVFRLEGWAGNVQILVEDYENYQFSEYKAVRDTSKILHETKSDSSFSELRENIELILYEVDTGEINENEGMEKISHAVFNLVEEQKALIVPEVEEIVAISGLANKIEVDVKVGDTRTFLNLAEDGNFPGRYVGEYTPISHGIPLITVFLGMIGETEVKVTLHPEEILPESEFQQDFEPETIDDEPMNNVESMSTDEKPIEEETGIEEKMNLEKICNEGMVLMKKHSTGSLACVKPESSIKLEKIGWGSIL